MNWHIQFAISGKKLEGVLSFIHALKPDDLVVQPIAVAAKSQGGNQKSQLLAIMQGKPEIKIWSAANVESLMPGMNRHRAGILLNAMHKDKLIRRVKPGRYAVMGGKR